MDEDYFTISVFEGEHESEGTRAIYNHHVSTIKIDGSMLPALLPANSDVDLTVNIDKSEKITVTAFFPYLDYSTDIEIEPKRESVETSFLENEIRKAKGSISELKLDGNTDEKLNKVEKDIEEIDKAFQNNKNDIDTKSKALTDLRKSLKVLDELNATTEWPKLEEEIKEEFYRLEKANTDLGNDKTTALVNQLRNQVEEVLQAKDVKLGNVLLDEINSLFVQITFVYQLMGFIQSHNNNFSSFNWKDSSRARTLLNQGMQKMSESPEVSELHPIVIALIDLLPNDERPSGDDSVLVG